MSALSMPTTLVKSEGLAHNISVIVHQRLMKLIMRIEEDFERISEYFQAEINDIKEDLTAHTEIEKSTLEYIQSLVTNPLTPRPTDILTPRPTDISTSCAPTQPQKTTDTTTTIIKSPASSVTESDPDTDSPNYRMPGVIYVCPPGVLPA